MWRRGAHATTPVPSVPYDADAPWRARLEKVARENWDRFHRPRVLEVTPLRPVLGPNTIARYDHELTALDGIGSPRSQ